MDNTKLQTWSSIAEIIGAVAVVISLIYVGIQVNDGTSAVRAASANDANVALQAWYLQAGSDAQTSSVLYRGLLAETPLPGEEEFQFLMITHAAFLGFQNSFLLAEEGTIDEKFLTSLTETIANIDQLPGMNRYWRQRKSYFHPDFVAWVDRVKLLETDISMDIYRLNSERPGAETPD